MKTSSRFASANTEQILLRLEVDQRYKTLFRWVAQPRQRARYQLADLNAQKPRTAGAFIRAIVTGLVRLILIYLPPTPRAAPSGRLLLVGADTKLHAQPTANITSYLEQIAKNHLGKTKRWKVKAI